MAKKRTTTLMNEADALTREACALVDLRDDMKDAKQHGSELYTAIVRYLQDVRARRDALLQQIKTRDPRTPRNYVRAYLYT
jgi:hypothetical protein